MTDDHNWQIAIFLFVFLTYLLSITGNLTIILLTLVDSHLKTPMHFFLRNFSILEISWTSTCIPKFLVGIVTMDKKFPMMLVQPNYFSFIFFRASESFLLAAMSYDRYVAICKPLHYVNMSSRVCIQLVLSSWLSGLLTVSVVLIIGLGLEFCDVNIIDHFICDYSPVLKVSCTDTHVIELLSSILAIVTLLLTLALVILFYANIIRTVLKIPSAQQRKKAFSTCSSHMIVVSISYGSCIFMYIKPSAEERVSLNKVVAVLSTSIVPVLNPLVYTLRNKQVKQAMKNIIRNQVFITLK